MSLKILGAGISPFVRKVRVVCAEKGLDYELEPVIPMNPPPGWRDVSPLGKIPALEHDGRVVNDSSVICAYLERIAPEPALYPADPYACARATWLEEYADGGLVPVAGPKVFMPVVLRPLLSGGEPESAAIDAAAKAMHEEVGPLLAYLEQQIGDAEFFVEDRLSIADISVASMMVNLRHAGFPPDAERFPKVAAFVQRMHARPSFRACIDEEKQLLGKRWA